MGIRTYIRTTRTEHSVTYRSHQQADRAYRYVVNHPQCTDVRRVEKTIMFTRVYRAVGGFPDDEEQFQRRVDEHARTHGQWGDSDGRVRRKVHEEPRPLDDIVRSVRNSIARAHPQWIPKIEGSAQHPAKPVVLQLHNLGLPARS